MRFSECMKSSSLLVLLIPITSFISTTLAPGAGKVYLVLGSDTAIWEGMDVRSYHCYYNIDLYTNPSRNAYKVMEPAFRAQFVDSYGQPLKMTWWMMCGNIFRYADNKNVPISNIMTMYLMKKYHGDNVQQNGDELSLHYHTFAWTDYNGDGIYYWNQSLTFLECLNDFNFTLCQLLLEENVFPVSFRSGWHYMDNDWQHYLNELLPYSMHNDWPNVRTDTIEPLDNTYDWSEAPQEFVPYHPSPQNYQIPGDSPGWNVRSAHFFTVRHYDLMDYIFEQANLGIDQVACIWGHLPEVDFLENIEIIDSLAHQMVKKYPDVKFRYCTAIEAMQRWRGTSDTVAPKLTIEEIQSGDDVFINVKTDEPIFQPRPFIAAKNIYEDYFIVPCQALGEYEWQTTEPLPKNQLAKIGVVVCDTVGNQAKGFINFLPDDIFIDNSDPGYVEVCGNWSTSTHASWGLDSRVATLSQNDSVKVRWMPNIQQSGYKNIFIQIPSFDNAVEYIIFKIYDDGECIDTVIFNQSIPTMDWVYIGTAFFTESGEDYLEMSAYGIGQAGRVVAADVVKISSLVRERDLKVDAKFVNLGEISLDDTVSFNLKVTNCGFQNLTIYDVTSAKNTTIIQSNFPIVISGMSSVNLSFQFHYPNIGPISDTLFIISDDPIEPQYPVIVNASIQLPFVIIDNEDSLNYVEEGNWYYSNAQAYGPTSRYAPLNQTPLANATFFTTLKRNGVYEIFEIVPTTVNASNYAVYVLSISDVVIDSVIIDQNQGSGNWVFLGRYYLPAGLPIEVKVVDTGKSTAGYCLRADAIKFSLIQELSSIREWENINKPSYVLYNRPNPFSNITEIRFLLPRAQHISLKIYNSAGRLVRILACGKFDAGIHTIRWDGRNSNGTEVASGMYFYQLKTENQLLTRKMVHLR